MGAKALILISMVALACAANAAEEMTAVQQLQNEGSLSAIICSYPLQHCCAICCGASSNRSSVSSKQTTIIKL